MTRISLFHRCAYATLTKSTFDDSRRRGARQFVEATFFALTTHLDGVFLRSRSFSTEATNNDSNAALRVWNARYQELLQYTQNNGNALVPRDYKNNRPLGHWVDKQRSNYKKNNLRPDRIEKLEEIGFVWEPQEVSWSERFNELLDYIKKHGNSLVPQDYEQNVTLGNWVQRQRYKYKTNDLPEERIQQLSEIGFVWDVLQAQWLERLEELKKYRREYGDTLVPRNHLLGSWVWWQRRDYKVFNAKKKLEDGCNNLDASEVERITNSTTGMTEDRIRLLEAEEFIWDPKEYLWELKLEELREWIALNGHGAIVTRKKNNSPLETWATRQRKLFRKYCKGEQTTLTKERIEKLRIVGFVFEIAKS